MTPEQELQYEIGCLECAVNGASGHGHWNWDAGAFPPWLRRVEVGQVHALRAARQAVEELQDTVRACGGRAAFTADLGESPAWLRAHAAEVRRVVVERGEIGRDFLVLRQRRAFVAWAPGTQIAPVLRLKTPLGLLVWRHRRWAMFPVRPTIADVSASLAPVARALAAAGTSPHALAREPPIWLVPAPTPHLVGAPPSCGGPALRLRGFEFDLRMQVLALGRGEWALATWDEALS